DEVAVVRDRRPDVAVQLIEDVAERRRRAHARPDGECESVRVTGCGVGILAEDEDARDAQRGQLEGEVRHVLRWQDLVCAPFALDDAAQLLVVRCPGLAAELSLPAGRDRWQHEDPLTNRGRWARW